MECRQAVMVLETLLNGADPTTGEVLPQDHICRTAEVMDALEAAIMALKAYPPTKSGRLNAGRPWPEQDNQYLIHLYLEHTSIDDICRAMQRRSRGVRNQLRELGFDPDNDEILVSEEKRSEKHPADKHGKPWTNAEHEWMMSSWEKGLSLEEIAASLGRTPCAIRMRLEKYGRYEGGTTVSDEPPAWTDTDGRELIRLIDAGCTVDEMAERFGRTRQAMEARMFYLGLSKKPPKLF